MKVTKVAGETIQRSAVDPKRFHSAFPAKLLMAFIVAKCK